MEGGLRDTADVAQAVPRETHGEDPTKVCAELCEVIDDVIVYLESEGRALPGPKVMPMQELV